MPVTSEKSRRLHALGYSVVALTLLAISYFLTPSTDGVGTHQQLGLPTCGWILAANLPCPTCGMTTSWSHAVRGELPSAFMAQPLGMVLAFAAFLVAIGGLITASTGFSFAFLLYRFSPTKIIVAVAIVAIASWGFKILLHRGVL
jgi:hypothetical protein